MRRIVSTPERLEIGKHAYPADFYGFPEVPFHVHLGMRFERSDPRGPATVTLPARHDLLADANRHSIAALYTVGEVAAGIAICDALLLGAREVTTTRVPLVLTRRAVFEPLARPRGNIRSRTMLVGDVPAALDKLRSSRKVKVEAAGAIVDDHDGVAARIRVFFYVRLMEMSSLQAIAGALIPAMVKGAQGALDPHARVEAR